MKKYNEKLFSYGTLQQESVQLETFGRKLKGASDTLCEYKISKLKITDPEVIRKSGKKFHPVIKFSGDKKDKIPGMVFEITKQELEQADEYEAESYKRISVKLLSGADAWVYVNKE